MLYATGECFREMQLADAYALLFAAPLLIGCFPGWRACGPARTLASGWVEF
jgi:integral membrane sensor domain MASE1